MARSGLTLGAVPAQVFVPAASVEDVTEGGLPLTQACLQSFVASCSLMRGVTSQAQGVTIMGYTIINQIGYAGLLLHIYSLPPIHLMCIFQLFMSSPATTRLPRLMRARDHACCVALPKHVTLAFYSSEGSVKNKEN
jgi:hypothetical protein